MFEEWKLNRLEKKINKLNSKLKGGEENKMSRKLSKSDYDEEEIEEELEEERPRMKKSGLKKISSPQHQDESVKVVEQEINLTLINSKLNYLTSLILKIAESSGIDLE